MLRAPATSCRARSPAPRAPRCGRATAPIAAALLASCASSSPTSRADRGPRPDRPSEETHLLATGSSADGREAAREHARAALSRQIASSVESELDTLARVLRGRGGERETGRYVERVRVESSFEHAELMEVVRHRPPSATGRGHVVTMALPRARTDRVLRDESRELRQRFEVLAEEARKAAERNDRERLALNWQKLQRVAAKLDAIDLQRRAVRGRPVPAQEERAKTLRELLDAAARLRERIRVLLAVEAASSAPEGSAELREGLATVLSDAIGELGLRGRVADGEPACPIDGRADAIRLVARPSVECRRGSLGHHCRATVELRARECGSQEAEVASAAGGGSSADEGSAGDLFRARLRAKAVAPEDAARARRHLLEKLRPEAVATLREQLGRHVPLP